MLAYIGTICFTVSILHAFVAAELRQRLPRPLDHLLGEVEFAFPVWATVYLIARVIVDGFGPTVDFVRAREFHEVAFIFVITAVCSLRPVARLIAKTFDRAAAVLPLSPGAARSFSALTLGPLFGSLVTETAAMTVTALSLRGRVFTRGASDSLRYDALATLFVNVSVGGTLSRYAAAPILVVADGWGWDSIYVIRHFGGPAVLTCVLNAAALVFVHRQELSAAPTTASGPTAGPLFDLRAAGGTALFLIGLLLLGPAQRWWIEPILTRLPSAALYVVTAALTAVVDNAALTYLAAQVPELSEVARRAVVAGAVAGGGLTLLANAPNAAGYALLKATFPRRTVRAGRLLRAAARPTLVALVTFAFA